MNFDAIVIDTSIYQRYAFRFDQGLLKALEQFSGKPAGLLVPEIIAREIMDHISHKASEAVLQLERALKVFDDEVGLSVAEVTVGEHAVLADEVARRKLGNFIKATGAKLIKTEGLLNVQQLIDCYFHRIPPFSGKKKSEFPDAITLLVIEEYARRNDIRVLAVSADNDWKEYISRSERISYTDDLAKAISEFQQQTSLFEICEHLSLVFADPDPFYRDKLGTELSKACLLHEFNYEAYSEFTWESQYMSLEYIDYDFFGGGGAAKFYPVSTQGDRLTVETKVTISAKAIGEFSLFLYDSIVRGGAPNVPIGGARKEVHLKITASIMFTTDLIEMEILGPLFHGLEISFDPIHVDFGALEAA